MKKLMLLLVSALQVVGSARAAADSSVKEKVASDYLVADLNWIARPDSSTIKKAGSKKQRSKKKSGKRRHKKHHDRLMGVRKVASKASTPSCSSQPIEGEREQITESSQPTDTALDLTPAKVATKLYLKKWRNMTFDEQSAIDLNEFRAVLKNMRQYRFKKDPVLAALFIGYCDSLKWKIENIQKSNCSTEDRTIYIKKIVKVFGILYALRLSHQRNTNMQIPQYYHETLVAAEIRHLLHDGL